jgi:hypothetical protein
MIKEFAKLTLETRGHKKELEAVVTGLNKTDMFMGHDWLTKHNPVIDWEQGEIRFECCPPDCRTNHKMVTFGNLRQLTHLPVEPDDLEDDKETTPMDINALPPYVQPYIHLFQKNFDKLPEHTEWDHEINLTDNAPRELKAKVYPMTVKERKEYMLSSKKIWNRDESDLPNHHTHRHASLFPKRTIQDD